MRFKYIIISTVAALILNVCFSYVFSEDNVEENTTEIEAEEQNKSATTPKISSGKRGEIPTLEEFNPSEEVSADKPVAFPVDI